MTVIDVHTHMITLEWLDAMQKKSKGKYGVKKTKAGQDTVYQGDTPFMTLFPEMWDYKKRIADMDKAGVDIAIVSLTSPNVFWGAREASLAAAQQVNDSMADQQRARPDRIRWFTSLPWQYPQEAKAELARTVKAGAVGVMVLANIDGRDLTDSLFAPTWAEIDKLGLPVLVHPTNPQGADALHMNELGLVPPIGFMVDTTVAISRMILAGFIDKHPNLKLIAAHGGAALPYLAGRLDRCHEMIPACAEFIKDKPSTYLQRIWYDSVVMTSVRWNFAFRWRARRIACCMVPIIRTISATWLAVWRGSTRCRAIRPKGSRERRPKRFSGFSDPFAP